MIAHRSVACTAAAALITFSSERAAAQIPPETSVYELVDIVPPAAPVACGCVSAAFALPAFRPGSGWGTSPATPAEHSPWKAQALAERRAEERAALPHDAADGLAGNGHASLSVAMHLREASLEAGIDARTEEEVARWLHLAAAQEHPDALTLLGYRYQRGHGVPQSDEAAAYLFQQGALRGDKTSMVALGLRYAAGRGVPQDYAAAVRWWRRADTTPLALRFLGDAYACGLGVDQNADRAVREYTRSADAGDMSSNLQLGRIHIGGCVAANDEAAAKAFRRAADVGDPEAQIALSELLLQGRGVEMNASEAYFWARIAERRLGPGEQQTLASARAKAAARMMSPDETAAAEKLIESMIAASAKPMH
jgi:TPR repeat protein